jgi:hypothetical protein
MEVEFRIVDVTHPLWFKLAILGTVVFVPSSSFITRPAPATQRKEMSRRWALYIFGTAATLFAVPAYFSRAYD